MGNAGAVTAVLLPFVVVVVVALGGPPGTMVLPLLPLPLLLPTAERLIARVSPNVGAVALVVLKPTRLPSGLPLPLVCVFDPSAFALNCSTTDVLGGLMTNTIPSDFGGWEDIETLVSHCFARLDHRTTHTPKPSATPTLHCDSLWR